MVTAAPDPERLPHGLTIGLALLLTAGGALSLPARSRAYTYNLPEFPSAEQAVTIIAPRLAPGDKVLVLGMSLTPFLYYARRHGLPYLSYVYDYVLEGWAPLRSSKRIFVVVIDPRQTVADVLTEAHLADAPAPVEIASARRRARLPHNTRLRPVRPCRSANRRAVPGRCRNRPQKTKLAGDSNSTSASRHCGISRSS